MALLDILTVPDSRLREKSLPVEKVDRGIRTLKDNLFDTLYHLNAAGLAAPQVGVHKRVIVVDVGEHKETSSEPLFMVNPQIHWMSATTQVTTEGCFSVPTFFEDVVRPLEIKVSYLDENNHPQLLSASGLLADCIQHEIDHLDGVLFIDHLSLLRRTIILTKIRKGKQSAR